MESEETARPGIAAVVDLALQIDADERLTAGELRRRDRAIGRALEPLKGSPGRQLLAWLPQVSGKKESRLGSSVERGLRVGSLLLGVAGMILGGLTTSAVFFYNGQRPVNVIHVLAVFVALQLILVAALLLTLLPLSVLRRVPGSAAVAETLQMLSPGRLQRLASRYLPEEYRRRGDALLGASRAHRLLFGRLEKWLVVSSSQLFAVAFNCGALLSGLYLISFSDMAFAWSTTLQVTAADVHSLTSLLSAPWKDLVPDADPSLALIESSRYYRLGEGLLPEAVRGAGPDPALLGGWWSFLVMSMLVYGLLPRVALWAFSRWRLHSAVNGAMLHLPGVANLLGRMNREYVQTQATEAEILEAPPAAEAAAAAAHHLRGGSCAFISWSDASGDDAQLSRDAAESWGCVPTGMLAAGGANSLAQDGEVVRRAASRIAGGGGAIVFVRAWEPPLDEFLDFLRDLRLALPRGAPIVVAPLGTDGGASPGENHIDMWRLRLRRLGDPWLSVERLRREA